MPYSAARLLFRRKYVYADGAIVEMRAWSVLKSPRMPEGYKYSLVYIGSHGNRVLGYDNAEGKGHHRHEGPTETPVTVESMRSLLRRFLEEVKRIRGQRL